MDLLSIKYPRCSIHYNLTFAVNGGGWGISFKNYELLGIYSNFSELRVLHYETRLLSSLLNTIIQGYFNRLECIFLFTIMVWVLFSKNQFNIKELLVTCNLCKIKALSVQ